MRSRVIVTTLSLLIVGALSVVLTLHSSTPHYDNAVTGQLLISGGPAPGTPRPSDGEVTARNVSGKSFSISVPSSGKFHFATSRRKLLVDRLIAPVRERSIQMLRPANGDSAQRQVDSRRCLLLRKVDIGHGSRIPRYFNQAFKSVESQKLNRTTGQAASRIV